MTHIRIKRAGFMLGSYKEDKFPGYFRRKRTIEVEEGKARVISPRLAIYKHNDTFWHVIHIPTGLVIADVQYGDIGLVRQSFESHNWTLRGDHTFVLLYESFTWEMECLIRYEVIEDDQSV